jgi:hypothetical protein
MSSTADVFLKAILVGVGGTIVLDLYAFMMSRVLGAPVTTAAGSAISLMANSFRSR